MDVSVLLTPKIDLERLREVLDGLGHEGRVHTTRTWTKETQSALFEAANDAIDLAFLVPASIAARTEVIHDGHNTLGAFSNFQKRFAKLEDGTVIGFNHQPPWSDVFSGPGYFVCRAGEGDHARELVIDYTVLPKDRAEGWPKLASNDGGFGPSIVFGGMVDYLRVLSTHVSIGRAFKKGVAMDQFFALVRRDPA